MTFDTIYILYGAIFMAALLLVEGLYYLFTDGKVGRDAVNRRMKMLEAGATTREVFETLRVSLYPVLEQLCDVRIGHGYPRKASTEHNEYPPNFK